MSTYPCLKIKVIGSDYQDYNHENDSVINSMLERISILDYLLDECNFRDDEAVNDELEKINTEAKQKIMKILKTTDIEYLIFNDCEDDD